MNATQLYNLKMAEEIKSHNKELRTKKSVHMTPAYTKASEIYREVKRQGAINDERRFEEIRKKVLTRNPRLCNQ